MDTNNQLDIFIVEDNEIFQLALKADIESAFAKMAIKIHSFGTGEACMKTFSEVKPEVVILDYNLNSKNPDAMNGIRILDRIKKENYKTNVVMLTSEDNIDIAVKSFLHGASDYVVKTETQFKKLNYSLFNIFRTIEAKNDAKKYKRISIGLFLCIALFIGGIIAIQIVDPTLLK